MRRFGPLWSLRAALMLVVTVAALAWSAGMASAQSFTVNDESDAPLATAGATTCATSAGGCTLRAAVQAADNLGGSSTIALPPGDFQLTIAPACSGSSSAGCDANDPARGDLDVDNHATISLTGAGSSTSTVDAGRLDRAFEVQPGGGLTLSGLTITDGSPSRDSTGAQNGGAIYSAGSLTLAGDVTLSDNSVPGSDGGGAIYADNTAGSSLTVDRSSFQNNAGYNGAAIYDDSPVTMNVTGTSFSGGNTGDAYGGAIYGDNGAADIGMSSFTANSAYTGGAIYWQASSTISVSQSTFSQNQATDGGAIADNSDDSGMTLSNDTFSENSGFDGGALYLYAYNSFPSHTLVSDQFIGNSAPDEGGAIELLAGSLSSNGSSFIDNHSNGYGGAIYQDVCDIECTNGQLTLINTTMSDNVAGYGGALYNDDVVPATLTNDTIADNTASQLGGGGIAEASDLVLDNGSDTTGSGVENTILAENRGGDCGNGATSGQQFATSFDVGHNLDSDGTCFSGAGAAADKTGVNPRLAAPAANGGSVFTDAETAASATVDAGASSGAPTTDARGVSRPQGAATDIGAFEFTAAPLAVTNAAPASAAIGMPYSDTITVADAGASGYATGTVVTAAIPANERFFGATASQGTCSAAASTVTCTLGAIAAGSSASIALTVAGTEAGTVTNFATATDDAGASSSQSAATEIAAAPAAGSAPAAMTGTAAPATTTALVRGNVTAGNQRTAYFFQYGSSRAYGKVTPVSYTASDAAVSATIRGLTAGTRYHYRLVAINDTATSYGRDASFRTKGATYSGALRLVSSKLAVRSGRVYARFSCQSARACTFRFSIDIRALIAGTRKTGPILFTKSSNSAKTIGSGKTVTVSGAVTAAAMSLLRHRGSLRGKLSTKPRTPQRGVIEYVTLR